MFVGIFSRMIPSQALMSAIPEITKRGSFNTVNASVQQISGGIASVIAGVVVAQGASGDLQHFDRDLQTGGRCGACVVRMASVPSLCVFTDFNSPWDER
jgi:hypothetical protein